MNGVRTVDFSATDGLPASGGIVPGQGNAVNSEVTDVWRPADATTGQPRLRPAWATATVC